MFVSEHSKSKDSYFFIPPLVIPFIPLSAIPSPHLDDSDNMFPSEHGNSVRG